MRLWFFNFLLFLIPTIGFSQRIISGKVLDSYTGEPLAFTNIVFNDNHLLQITSDINGDFSFKSSSDITRLRCSFVGYFEKEIKITPADTNLTIMLVPSTNALNEVSVYPGENPALRIIKKVIENKDLNNPEKIGSFSYQCYNKLIADFKLKYPDEKNRLELEKFTKGKHLLIMESVTKRKFITPDVNEEEVLATKVSGFKNPMFASVATEMQPFAFYQDDIKLLDIHYLNPISLGSLKKYKFRIEDTYLKEKDTVFIISFLPKSNKNFEGLKGLLYINSNKYALQNVIATPHEKGTINLKIQQQYQLIDGEYWFPEQLNYTLQLDEYPQKNLGIIAEGKSYISSVALNIPLRKKDFPLEHIHIASDATKKDSLFWSAAREEKLNAKELKTYTFMDSLGQKKQFDRMLSIIEKFSRNRIGVSFVDIDLSKTIQYNKYEKTRIGTGIYTNELLSEKFNFGGFFGYGKNDETWKYGYEANYVISKKNNLSLGISHQNNLVEIGNAGLKQQNNNVLDFRKFLGYFYDNIHQNSMLFHFRSFRYLNGTISINRTSTKSLYSFAATPENYSFKNTDLKLFLRFAYKEKFVQIFNTNQSMGTEYPIVYLFISKGMKSVFDGDLDYTKFEIATEQNFYTKNFGKTHYRIEAGHISKTLPLGLRFTGEGSYDLDNPYISKNTFQAMLPYEFLSDSYANVFLSHHFGTLLLKTKIFQPSISIHNNLSWGTTISELQNNLTLFKNKEKIYAEAGLQFDNIIKLKMARIAYFGIGSAVFCRYGHYSNPDFTDNLAYKITFQLTIK